MEDAMIAAKLSKKLEEKQKIYEELTQGDEPKVSIVWGMKNILGLSEEEIKERLIALRAFFIADWETMYPEWRDDIKK
jgi:hypothetical protein